MSLPPSAMGARSRDPEPSELHGLGPRVKICSWSCLSWLHPLRSWSLRQTRGGSEWKDKYLFDDFDEVEKAWKKIDLFSMGAIYLIDSLRSTLARTREDTARCLEHRNEDGNISFVDAVLYRHHCEDIELKATELIKSLN